MIDGQYRQVLRLEVHTDFQCVSFHVNRLYIYILTGARLYLGKVQRKVQRTNRRFEIERNVVHRKGYLYRIHTQGIVDAHNVTFQSFHLRSLQILPYRTGRVFRTHLSVVAADVVSSPAGRLVIQIIALGVQVADFVYIQIGRKGNEIPFLGYESIFQYQLFYLNNTVFYYHLPHLAGITIDNQFFQYLTAFQLYPRILLHHKALGKAECTSSSCGRFPFPVAGLECLDYNLGMFGKRMQVQYVSVFYRGKLLSLQNTIYRCQSRRGRSFHRQLKRLVVG